MVVLQFIPDSMSAAVHRSGITYTNILDSETIRRAPEIEAEFIGSARYPPYRLHLRQALQQLPRHRFAQPLLHPLHP